MDSKNMAQYMANRRSQRRQKLVEMSGSQCEVCGAVDNLEFNHKDRRTKSFDLSGCALDKAWIKIVEEWEKCELLCQPHHLEHTRGLYATKQIQSWNSNKHLPYIHGTMRTYHEQSCRCEPCRKAKSLYRNKETTYSEIIDL